MGGVARDSFQLQFSREIERLQAEVIRLQLELLASEGRYTADHDRWLVEIVVQMISVQWLEDQILRAGITHVTRTSSSSQGRTSTSSSPSPAGIPRD